MKVDFGRTADDYARYRVGVPEALFARLDGYGIGRAGQRILDLGSGTGSLARGFAQRGARVTALDLSADLLAQARALAIAEGLEIGPSAPRPRRRARPGACWPGGESC